MSRVAQQIGETDRPEQLGLGARMARGLERSRLSIALDLVLPPLCIHCRRPAHDHGQLCGECWSGVDFIAPPLCDISGVPLPFDSGGRQLSARALHHPPVYRRARATAHYSGVMRALVHGLKYADRREGLPLFGRWLALAGAELLEEADLLMPVPLYRTRLWRRRFNQSALLARELSRLTGLPANMLALRRRRATRSQVGLSELQRQRNVAGAFTVPARQHRLIAGRRIVLVDDVLTTGATLDACARALHQAGAENIDVLVLALVTGQEARPA